MPRWVAILFWIWFFVSLVILVMRRVNKRGAPSDDATAPGSPAPTTAPRSAGGVVSPGAAATPATEKVWPAPPPPDPDDDTYRMEPHPLASPSAQPSTPGGDPTPLDHAPGEVPATLPVRATLPELLAGITLPHELVPLTQSDVSVDLSTHIVVSTQKASAEVVTTAMCDELEQLGYDIERESMLKVRAIGDRGTVLVEVHPDGASVLDGTVRRFPTAREGSVVVEIWAA